MYPDEIDDLIHRAMESLAESTGNFGFTKRGQRNGANELERRFQIKLHATLNELSRDRKNGWTWCREVGFPTMAFPNDEVVVDIVGWHSNGNVVPIELKYVTMQQWDDDVIEPSNPPAFPYDVLKDCLRLESLMMEPDPHNGEAGPPGCGCMAKAGIMHAVGIGLTNYRAYWQEEGRVGKNCWSRNSFRILRQDQIEFSGDVKTVKRANLDNTIYKQERNHLSFGTEWRGEWRGFLPCDDPPVKAPTFRYVYLRPADPLTKPDYSHERNDPAYVPFLNDAVREAFFKSAENLPNSASRPELRGSTPSSKYLTRSDQLGSSLSLLTSWR